LNTPEREVSSQGVLYSRVFYTSFETLCKDTRSVVVDRLAFVQGPFFDRYVWLRIVQTTLGWLDNGTCNWAIEGNFTLCNQRTRSIVSFHTFFYH